MEQTKEDPTVVLLKEREQRAQIRERLERIESLGTLCQDIEFRQYVAECAYWMIGEGQAPSQRLRQTLIERYGETVLASGLTTGLSAVSA